MFDARGHKFHDDSTGVAASAQAQLPGVCEEQVGLFDTDELVCNH